MEYTHMLVAVKCLKTVNTAFYTYSSTVFFGHRVKSF